MAKSELVQVDLNKPTGDEPTLPGVVGKPPAADATPTLEVVARKMLLAGRRYEKGQEWLKEAAEAGAGKKVAEVLGPFDETAQASILSFLIAIGAA